MKNENKKINDLHKSPRCKLKNGKQYVVGWKYKKSWAFHLLDI